MQKPSTRRSATTIDTKSSRSPQIPPAISYRLADSTFLKLGWTTQCNISLAFPVVTMKAKFAHPVISPWFKEREEDTRVTYENGKTLYFARKDGTGKIYYPNGKWAVHVEKGGINKYRTRIWVQTSGEVCKDGVKRPSQLCALFDSLGCGVVYDHCMRKRLVYNQTEGILLDSPSGVPIRWKWHDIKFDGSLSIMNEEDDKTSLLSEAPKRIIGSILNEGKFLKEKESSKSAKSNHTFIASLGSSKLSKSEIEFREAFEHEKYVNTAKIYPRQVSPVKPVVVQLNSYIALKIWTQSEITLTFFAQAHQTQLKIGVLYNPQDKLKVSDVDEALLRREKVFCPFEILPAKTISMARFKKIVQSVRTTHCIMPPGVTAAL